MDLPPPRVWWRVSLIFNGNYIDHFGYHAHFDNILSNCGWSWEVSVSFNLDLSGNNFLLSQFILVLEFFFRCGLGGIVNKVAFMISFVTNWCIYRKTLGFYSDFVFCFYIPFISSDSLEVDSLEFPMDRIMSHKSSDNLTPSYPICRIWFFLLLKYCG